MRETSPLIRRSAQQNTTEYTFRLLSLFFFAATVAFLVAWLVERPNSCPTTKVQESFDCDPYPALRALQNLDRHIERTAITHGTVSCQDYLENATLHSGKKILIVQECVNNGTFRITTPGHFQLVEHIVFSPLPENNFLPYPNMTQYTASLTYQLGFIAAFTLEAQYIVFDLNGFSITQSSIHRIKQRFYAHIELAHAHFVASQGPIQFTEDEDIVGAHSTIIKNGHLGLSSHHGIHGNGVQSILIENLTIADYEVAAVSINDGTDVVLHNVYGLGNAKDVPVLATFTSAQFIDLFVQRALTFANGSFPTKEATLLNASLYLKNLISQVESDIDNGSGINQTTHPEAFALFSNPQRVLDGNAYGFLFHRQHAAVNGFQCQWMEPVEGQRTTIIDSSVANIEAHVIEVVALQNVSSEKFQVDPTGGLLRLETLMNQTTGEYQGTALSQVKIALADLVHELNATQQTQFSHLNIDASVIDWAYNGAGSTNLTDLIAQGKFVYRRNGDSQLHVNKGVSGLRMDGLLQTCVRNFSVVNISNTSPAAQTTPLLGEEGPIVYSGPNDLGHVAQTRHGANKANAVGIILSSMREARFTNIVVEHISALFGTSRGIDVNNDSVETYFHTVIIRGIVSTFYTIMDEITLSVGLHWNTPENPHLSNVTISNVSTDGVVFEILQAREDIPPPECQGFIDIYNF